MTTLKTHRLLLRPWRTGDESSLVELANNRKISINLRDRFPFPYTQKDADEWIAFSSGQSPVYCFALEQCGRAIGGISLMPGEDIYKRSAEIGYWLGEPFWGQGLMPEAVTAVTEYGLKTLGVVRIFAGVFDSNPASTRVLEKAGFTFESRMKKSVFKDGQILDQLMYVRTL